MKTLEQQQADLDKAREYINSAPTPEERQRRKLEMYRGLYSVSCGVPVLQKTQTKYNEHYANTKKE